MRYMEDPRQAELFDVFQSILSPLAYEKLRRRVAAPVSLRHPETAARQDVGGALSSRDGASHQRTVFDGRPALHHGW